MPRGAGTTCCTKGARSPAASAAALRLKGLRSTNPVVVGDEVVCEADRRRRRVGDRTTSCRAATTSSAAPRTSRKSRTSSPPTSIRRCSMATLRSQPETAPGVPRTAFWRRCEAYKVPATILLAEDTTSLRPTPRPSAAFRAGLRRRRLPRRSTSRRSTARGVDAVRALVAGLHDARGGQLGRRASRRSIQAHSNPSTGRSARASISDEPPQRPPYDHFLGDVPPRRAAGALIDTPGIKGFGLIDIDDARTVALLPRNDAHRRRAAASTTAPTPTNRAVPCARRSHGARWRGRATKAT